jgi:uncharacterized protein YbaR (Trm112 family)
MDAKLLDILVCPVSKGALIYDKAGQELISVQAGLAYPVKDDIPVMLEEEARKLTPEEVEQWRSKR